MDARTRQVARQIAGIVCEAIPAKGIPSGHLYAGLMQAGVTLDLYNAVIGFLQKHGAISVISHYIHRDTKYEEVCQKLGVRK